MVDQDPSKTSDPGECILHGNLSMVDKDPSKPSDPGECILHGNLSMVDQDPRQYCTAGILINREGLGGLCQCKLQS